MDRPPMQPPSRQPIAFWSARAGEAVVARTRGALAGIGLSQPQWWVLHQLSRHPDGVSRAEVVATIGPNDTPAVAEVGVDETTILVLQRTIANLGGDAWHW